MRGCGVCAERVWCVCEEWVVCAECGVGVRSGCEG